MIRFAWLLVLGGWAVIAHFAVGAPQLTGVLLMVGAAPSLVAWARSGKP